MLTVCCYAQNGTFGARSYLKPLLISCKYAEVNVNNSSCKGNLHKKELLANIAGRIWKSHKNMMNEKFLEEHL